MDMIIATMMDVGIAIRIARHKHGLTQEQLASKSHVSRSWLAQVETGKSSFDTYKVLSVFAALGLTLEVRDNE
jgi:transcriptional regulator with XRE-family HTH domain